MLYAILAYHVENVVVSWTAEQDTAVMADLHEIHDKLTGDGTMGPAARLGGTKGAFTLRGPGAGVVIDGPFAETKEQLLGFYVVECATREDAIAVARNLRRVNPTAVYEIRPVQLFLPGAPKEATHSLADHVRGIS
ncbi:YciI family protein [Rhodopseudomonas boonkerdii]|uniref:YciI family protein n=1 Tax=Rhodopseudomonas boonkerdii TaxID=475937 RepID=UPI001E53CA73|nr:YciI family protein [Rhodopseudomonas boonkerdii]UGV28023.1 YciI family protein [Rhodopseudomonas boonkerdii]